MTNPTTLDELYRGIKKAYVGTHPGDRITCVQDFVMFEPVELRISIEVRAQTPEEALSKILLAAKGGRIVIKG